jgi:hypothetical protein
MSTLDYNERTYRLPLGLAICRGYGLRYLSETGQRAFRYFEPLGQPGLSSGRSIIQASAPCDLDRRCFGCLGHFFDADYQNPHLGHFSFGMAIGAFGTVNGIVGRHY